MFQRIKKITPKKRSKSLLTVTILIVIVGLTSLLVIPQPHAPELDMTIQNNTRSVPKALNYVKLKEYWEKVINKNNDLKFVYEKYLDETKKMDPGQQHILSHILGDLMFEKIGGKAISICDYHYGFGCYHGVSTKAIAVGGMKEVEHLNKFCETLKKDDIVACKHGIGHGLTEYFGHNSEKLNTTLRACDETYIGSEDLLFFGCLSGVFMEFNHPIIINDKDVKMTTRPVDNKGYYYPCTTVEEAYRPSCYHSLAQWWARFDEGNYKRLGDLCDPITNPEYSFACYRGIGNIIAPESSFDATIAKQSCEQIPSKEGQMYCKHGASLLFYGHGDLKKNRDIICKGLTGKYQEDCLVPKPRY